MRGLVLSSAVVVARQNVCAFKQFLETWSRDIGLRVCKISAHKSAVGGRYFKTREG